MRVFVGVYRHTLDPKRRLTIPSEWRSLAGDRKVLYVLPNFDNQCLNVYPAEEIEHRIEKIRKHSMTDSRAMEFSATLGGSSDVVMWDAQGRIRIKDRLLAFAEIQEQVILVGALDKFQLWTPQKRPDAEGIDQKRLREAGRYVDF